MITMSSRQKSLRLTPRAVGLPARLSMVLATALTLMLAGAAHAQPDPAGMGAEMHGMHRGGMGMGMGLGMIGHGRLLDSVGASTDQKARIHDIFKAAHDDLRAQHQAGRVLHEDMAKLLAAPTVDAYAVEALRQKIEAQHDAHSKRMTRAMIDASTVLTPEQRQKLAERMGQQRAMMERHQRERQSMDAAPRR